MERSLRALLAALLSLAALPAQELRDPLLGKVLAPDGAPVAGATIEVWRAPGSGTYLLDTAYRTAHRRIAVARSDADGAFAVHTPVGLPCRVTVDQPPFARFVADDWLPGNDHTIQLQETAGLLVEAQLADGTPSPCEVVVHRQDTGTELWRGTTDEHGVLLCERLPPVSVRLQLHPRQARQPPPANLQLTRGQTFEWRIKLEAGALLQGRVTDDAGRPIAGARVGEGWDLHRAVTTDADGRYRLPGYGGPGLRNVRCAAPGYVTAGADYPANRDQDFVADFCLQRGDRAIGRVLDRDGHPLADAYVHTFCMQLPLPADAVGMVSALSDADGNFSLSGLRPAIAQVLVVRRDGFGMRVYQLPPARDGAVAVGAITLAPARVVRGTLHDAAGKPIADAMIELRGYNADRDRLCPELAPDARVLLPPDDQFDMWGMIVGRRCIRTDAAGRFAFGDVADGTHLLTARSRRHELCQHGPFEVTAEPLPPLQLVYRD